MCYTGVVVLPPTFIAQKILVQKLAIQYLRFSCLYTTRVLCIFSLFLNSAYNVSIPLEINVSEGAGTVQVCVTVSPTPIMEEIDVVVETFERRGSYGTIYVLL